MSRPKQIAAVALSVAGLASMAACGGNDGSSGLTSTSSTATSSSSSTRGSAGPTSSSTTDKTSTPTATGARANIPEAAMKNTNAGAEAFVRYYSDQLNLAYRKGSPAPIDGLGTKNCEFCNLFISELRAIEKRGTHYESRVHDLKIIGTGPAKRASDITVVTEITELDSRQVYSTGRVYKVDKGEPPLRLFEVVRWTADGWRLLEVSKA